MASFYPHLYEAALELLITAREHAGLSQADLAARFGVTERLVSSYEADPACSIRQSSSRSDAQSASIRTDCYGMPSAPLAVTPTDSQSGRLVGAALQLPPGVIPSPGLALLGRS
jgi:hypothetical protein